MPAPQALPGERLPKSEQTGAPVWHLMMPVLQGVGLFAQLAFAVHAPQVPLPSQTMLVPHVVPAILLAPSVHVWVPVAHDDVPLLHGLGLVAHGWLGLQVTQAPLPSHT